MSVRTFGEMKRKDEMPRPCIFTSDFYSVSDPLKLKFPNQMAHGMENKQQKRRETSWLYIYRTIFSIALSDLNNNLSKKKVCVVIVLFFFSISLSLFLFQILSKQAMRQLGLRPSTDTMFVEKETLIFLGRNRKENEPGIGL